MTREDARTRLLGFLDGVRRPEVPLAAIADEDGLVSSGLVDSLVLFEIINFLESEFAIDFSASDFEPSRISTIASILDLIGEHPRKG